jgi:DNA polymerase-3 subunit alpha
MACVERVIERAAEALRDRRHGQGSFFDVLETGAAGMAAGEAMPDVPEWPENQLLAQEKALLGFNVSGHPLARFGGEIRKFATASTATLSGVKNGTTVKLCGIIAKVRITYTHKKNEKMAVAVLEDLEGTVELLLYPRVYEKVAPHIVEEAALLVTGRVEVEDENPKVIAAEVMPLAEAQQRCTAAMYVTVYLSDIEHGKLDGLKKLLEASPGHCPVFLDFSAPTGERVLMKAGRQFRVTPSPDLVRSVEVMLGESSVRLTA